MLYWHLGLKRTGTTSLQTALVVHEEQLRKAGVVYPREWMGGHLEGYSTHHGLTEVIESSGEKKPPFRQFEEYLEEHRESSVLLSSEFVSDWVAFRGKREEVLDTLAHAQSIMPVRCIWTLRRLDEKMNSLCLRKALITLKFPTLGHDDIQQVSRFISAMLAGMRRVEEVVGNRVTYLQYEADGSHNRAILRAVDLPVDVSRSIEQGLDRGPRLNPQLTYKGAIAIRFYAAISKRAGGTINWAAVRQALLLGQIEFENDRPCEMLGREVRQALHEKALIVAREHGIHDYVSFFADDEVEACSPISMDPSVLTDEDLERLASCTRVLEQRQVDRGLRQEYGGAEMTRTRR